MYYDCDFTFLGIFQQNLFKVVDFVTFAAYKNVNIWLKKAQNGEYVSNVCKDLFERKNIYTLVLGAL